MVKIHFTKDIHAHVLQIYHKIRLKKSCYVDFKMEEHLFELSKYKETLDYIFKNRFFS